MTEPPGTQPPIPVPARELVGITLEGGWTVESRFDPSPGATGGNFSYGYLARGPDGRRAFLKALDYSRATEAPDGFARTMEAMTAGFNHEVNLHQRCLGARMTRVVRSLGFGEIRLPGAQLPVNYLLFELADGDVRRQLAAVDRFDTAWRLRSLHEVAVGLQQLHREGIAHQDVKPSNVLVGVEGSKIGDLGSAALRGKQAPLFGDGFAGDDTYAPPECLYKFDIPDLHERAMARDMYLMGSLMLFYLDEVDATTATLAQLPARFRPGRWGGTFDDVLPYLRDAFGRVTERLQKVSLDGLTGNLVRDFKEMCEPDPRRRGHPKNRRGTGSSYSLERYVSALDRYARRAELRFLR